MINPMVVEGQIFGGVVQGMGGVLLEDFVYDDEGNPLTTTFMDYLPPTTTEVPDIEVGHIETESTTNPGGYKGMGEGGAIGAHAAVANAVADALRPLRREGHEDTARSGTDLRAGRSGQADQGRRLLSIGVERDGPIVTVTLDRPERLNALDLDHILTFRDELATLAGDGSVRVVVLTGAGRGFCAGGDVTSMTGGWRRVRERDEPRRPPLDHGGVGAPARDAGDHRRRGQRTVRRRGALVRVRVRPALRRALGRVRARVPPGRELG